MVVAVLVVSAPSVVSRHGERFRIRFEEVATARQKEPVRVLADYLRIDTSNPPGRTRQAVELWSRLFGCEGIPYTVVGDDPERPIFVARLAGRRRDGALLLLHHMDVVPPGDLSGWSRPPFAGEMGEGAKQAYLVGRGALDMKSVGVAFFAAMVQLKRDGIVPARDLVFVAEPGEESYTPEVGIGWVVTHRPDLLEGVTDVFNEGGTNESIAGRIERFGIEVLQKGTVFCWADAPREEPLEAFRKLLERKMTESPYRISEEVADFLGFIGPSRCDTWGRQMFDARRAVAAGRFNESLPEVYRALLRDMYYMGTVGKRGDVRTMEVAASLLPGSSTRARWEELQRWAAPLGVTLRLKFITADSVATPRTGRAWDALAAALPLDPEQAEVGLYVLTGSYTNASYLRARGFRVYGFSPFNVSFTEALSIHGADEKIDVVLFVEGVERMKAIVKEWATAPEGDGKEAG